MTETTEKRETYTQHVKCTNCGFVTSTPKEMVEIPLGMTFTTWAENYPCPTCGCNTLKQN